MKGFAILFVFVLTIGCAGFRQSAKELSVKKNDVGVEMSTGHGSLSVSTKNVLLDTDDIQAHAGFCIKLSQPNENDGSVSSFFKSLIGC